MPLEGIGGNEEMPAADHNYNDDPSLQTRTKVSSTVVNVKAGKQLKLDRLITQLLLNDWFMISFFHQYFRHLLPEVALNDDFSLFDRTTYPTFHF